jgi:hypothetical protein
MTYNWVLIKASSSGAISVRALMVIKLTLLVLSPTKADCQCREGSRIGMSLPVRTLRPIQIQPFREQKPEEKHFFPERENPTVESVRN